MEVFEIKEEHLKLLQNAVVQWQNCETGAPEIDPKRPYGNSWVVGDIANILDVDLEEDEYGDINEEVYDRLLKLHDETTTVLQICLQRLSFETGVFVNHNEFMTNWQKAEYVVEHLEDGKFSYFVNGAELIEFAKKVRDENGDNHEIEYDEYAIEYIHHCCPNLELDGGDWVLD